MEAAFVAAVDVIVGVVTAAVVVVGVVEATV
jgi:hypothetical protein